MPSELQPYVGPRPFEREERQRFFGREREASELLSRVIAHPAVLLYSQSGAGKTSLLNASLIPLLEKEGFEILPTARVRGLGAKDIPSEEIPNLYVFNVLMSWAGSKADPQSLAKMSIADFLNSEERPVGREGMPAPRVAVFDQFEELFTFYPERWNERQNFFEQVSEALERDRLMRITFVMREDYIAELDPFVSVLPEKLRTRFRLERLREEAALEAVTEPLDGTGYSFAPGVAEQLVNNLLKVPVETAAGVATVTGEFVEPVQLQVVCQTLWQKLDHSVSKEITLDQLKAFGDVDLALSGFYETAILTVSAEAGLNEGLLRRWFEHTLITPSGTRGTVFRGREETGGIPNAAVDKLVDQHLIRGELRGGARWYELTHDRLIEPIITSNHQWMLQRSGAEQTRQRLEKRAAEWVRSGRPKNGLLDEAELLEARRWLESPNADDVGYSEALFALVQASRAAVEEVAHERERMLFAEQQRRAEAEHTLVEDQQRHIEAQKQASRRLRRLAAALAVMFLLAIVTAGYAVNRSRLATNETQRAQQKEREAKDLLAAVQREKERANEQTSKANEAKLAADQQRVRAEELAKETEVAKKRAEEQAKLAAARELEARERERVAKLQAKKIASQADEILRLNRIDSVRQRASELRSDAYDLYQRGSYAAAIEKYEEARAKFEEINDVSNQARMLQSIGRLYSRQQLYADAEKSYKNALEILTGRDNSESEIEQAPILDDLGSLGLDQNENKKEAEEYFLRALAIRKKTPDNPDLAESYRFLGRFYNVQRNYELAEQYFQQALEVRKNHAGTDRPNLAGSYADLADFYYRRGQYAQAEPLFKEALAINEREKNEGSSGSVEALARSLKDLGSLYTFWGKYDDAEPLIRKAVDAEEQALGEVNINQPTDSQAGTQTRSNSDVSPLDLSRSLNELALVYYYRGKYPEAEKAYKRSLLIDESVRGTERVDPSKLHNLALVYLALADYSQVESLEAKVRELGEKAPKPDREAIYFRLMGMARLYREQARYADAEKLFDQIMNEEIKVKGPDHPNVGSFSHYRAQLYLAQGKYQKAIELEERALAIYKNALGSNSWRASVSQSSLASIYVAQADRNNYANAENLFKQALENLEKPSVLGPDHPEVATTLDGLARLYLAQDRLSEAEPLLKRSLAIREKVLGTGHPDVAASLSDYGLLSFTLRNYDDAEQHFKRALTILENKFGPEHPSIAETLVRLAALLRKTNREAEAAQMEARASTIRAKYQFDPNN
jgi:tetratricopeptide (TPR) repeat protein